MESASNLIVCTDISPPASPAGTRASPSSIPWKHAHCVVENSGLFLLMCYVVQIPPPVLSWPLCYLVKNLCCNTTKQCISGFTGFSSCSAGDWRQIQDYFSAVLKELALLNMQQDNTSGHILAHRILFCIHFNIILMPHTSGQSQWSKEACRKHLAAGLYFREANSARPETNKVRCTMVVVIMVWYYTLHQ